jgi:four helix bundle protein
MKAEGGWGKPTRGRTAVKDYGLRDRTKTFALRIITMFGQLPKSTEAQVLGKQALRAGTSVAANYREASRERSTAELIAKFGIVEQELDETLLWLNRSTQ